MSSWDVSVVGDFSTRASRSMSLKVVIVILLLLSHVCEGWGDTGAHLVENTKFTSIIYITSIIYRYNIIKLLSKVSTHEINLHTNSFKTELKRAFQNASHSPSACLKNAFGFFDERCCSTTTTLVQQLS